MNTTKTLKALYHYIIQQFQESEIDTPELDARIIISERTKFDWSDIIAKPNEKISDSDYSKIQNDVNQRITGKPLSRIYGEREFWGLPFEISKDTLDPRPDTELIIELALKRFPDKEPERILDLGTGSGCILIALLSEFPDSIGYGVDLSPEALRIAKNNAQRNHCDDRANFICGSWCDALLAQDISHKFDLIVSNPPYISNHIIQSLSKEVKNHDPILGLDGGDDGLEAYKNIFPQLKSLLSEGGIALFEIGYDQDGDVMRLSEIAGFALRTVHQDLAGNPRVVDISCGDK